MQQFYSELPRDVGARRVISEGEPWHPAEEPRATVMDFTLFM